MQKRTSNDTADDGSCVTTGSLGRFSCGRHDGAGVEDGSYGDLGSIDLSIGSNTDKMDVSKCTRLDQDDKL